ncbi:MAG: DegT/DnrJ/EryC1/StrS family aminotransferase [Kiritimatiellae bacterium]|nr:DegT/DnrJ/EryC1/StrS family aminotransferase [Kiritimatiellia bacterium]
MDRRIFLSPPWMSGDELPLVHEAFDSNYIAPCGPMVDRFERAFSARVQIPHAAALASGTAALDLLFHELGVTHGDFVFCSDLTFISSIGPAFHRGAHPVFLDCDEATWTMNPDLLEEALADANRQNRLPKAVVAVDLYGQCCDYDRLERICETYQVPLIVDAAEALGARYGTRSAGDAGMAAVYSFNGNKIITTSGGGMLCSRDRGIVERARKRSQQSREPMSWYEHLEVGYNYRMSNIVAAIGVGQLAHLDEILQKKREIESWYRAGLPEFAFMPEAPYGTSNRWLTVVQFSAENANKEGHPSATVECTRQKLEQENIESRPVWKPMHLQPVFQGCQCYGGSVSERLFTNGLCLPSGVSLTRPDVERVISILHRW